jgi:hypothetical protein
MKYDCVDSGLYGVVLVVYCRHTKKYLLLRELQDKPKVFKEKDMYGFASETKEVYDQSVLATVARLVYEELGVDLDGEIILSSKPLQNFRHKIAVYVAWVVVDTEFAAKPNDTDVVHGAWLSEDQIRLGNTLPGPFRIETIEVLNTVLRLGKSALI